MLAEADRRGEDVAPGAVLAELTRNSGLAVTLLDRAPDGAWSSSPIGAVLPVPRDAALLAVCERVGRTGDAEAVAFGTGGGRAPLLGWAFRTPGGVGVLWRRGGRGAGTGGLPEPDGADGLVGGWEWDVVAGVVRVSPTVADLLDLPPGGSAVPSADVLSGINPADRRRVAATLRAALDVDAPFTTRFTTAGDPPRVIRGIGRPVTVRGTRRVAGVLEDVTEATRAGQAVQRSQRLASLGMLAAGIAHDVNNVLTVVAMRADLIRSDALAGTGTDTAADAAAILDATARATALTRQLMLFAGQQDGEPRPVDAAQLVEGMRPLVESLRGSQVAVRFEVSAVPPVLADPAQLEQVLLNLALNARDALAGHIPAGDAEPLVLARVGPTATDLPGGTGVALEVVDNGPGMDEDTLARACDPFFTTKPVGKGTGLGLSVVFGVVERLGGRLDIASVAGVGTTVRVVLPACPAGAVPAGPADPDEQAPPRRLLVVEDEPETRAVNTRILERAGFTVLQADDGPDALAQLDRASGGGPGERIDALVSDVLIPGMDGTELAARVITDHPGVRVLLVTGISPPTDVLVHPRLAVISKPVGAAQLLTVLGSLLAAA